MRLKDLNKLHFQLGILFGTLILYLITNTLFGGLYHEYNFIPPILGLLILAELFFFVGLEVKEGAQEFGWKHEVVDTFIALGVAVAVWHGASFLLNTNSPISGVVSCSMLPNLYRGDFVIVQGAPIQAYGIRMTQAELDSITGTATVTYNSKNTTIAGSVFSYCYYGSSASELCREFNRNPEDIIERKGPFTYRYANCPLQLTEGTSTYQPCLKSVEYKGREYLTNFSHDTIVYMPPEGDYYSYVGDIVHRVFFKIDVDGEYYYLTRGDNNPVLDLQVYNYGNSLYNSPIPEENLRGRVLFRIPWLGYFKLFVAGYFDEDPQCRTQLTYPHV